MVAGPVNKKIAFIIQARMKSTRLPGKILLPLPLTGGKPLLKWITDALKSSQLKHDIIIATSKNQENNVLESFCKEQNVLCFRGEEEDVLSRFLQIIEHTAYDLVIRLTADNPFVDIPILEETIKFHIEQENDYTYTEGMPLGMNFEVISKWSLLNIAQFPLSKADREHVTLFIKNNDQYKKSVFTAKINPELKNLRLTIDYPSDFTLVSTILSQFIEPEFESAIKLIEKIFNQYPWLFEANIDNIQKKQFLDVNEEIKEAKVLLEHFDLKRAALLLLNKK